jgi:hypothetical protein
MFYPGFEHIFILDPEFRGGPIFGFFGFSTGGNRQQM